MNDRPHTATSPAPVAAVLLSGGRGRRFQEQDKGLVSWRRKPLVEHVIDRLASQCPQIIISCNRNRDHYGRYGLPLCADLEPGYAGPLAGLLAARELIQHRWCLLCPNDMPLLPDNLVSRLLAAATEGRLQAVYPRCGDRHHYLPVLLNTVTLSTLDNYLDSGQRSMHGWYRQLRTGTVDFSAQAGAFVNVNSPAILDQLG